MTLLSPMVRVIVEASHPGPESKEFPENDTNKNPKSQIYMLTWSTCPFSRLEHRRALASCLRESETILKISTTEWEEQKD